MIEGIIFKSSRLESEWNSGELDPLVKEMIDTIQNYSVMKFKKNIMVTCIFRFDDEQDQVYKDNEEYQKNPWKSNHQYWRAVDIRTRIFTQNEKMDIYDTINGNYAYDPKRPHKTSCVIYDNPWLPIHFQTHPHSLRIGPK